MLRRSARNALLMFAGEVGARLLGFLVAAVLARRLGVDGFGQVGFALSVMAWGLIASRFGLLTVGVREAARDRESVPRLAGNIIALRLLLAAAAVAGIAVFALLVPKPATVKWLLVLFGLSVPVQALLLEWVFTGTERMQYVATARIVNNLVYFVLVLVLVRGPDGLLFVPVSFAAAAGASVLLLLVVHAREFGWPRPGLDRRLARELLAGAWPVGLAAVLTQFHVGFGVVALSLLRGDRAAGLFNAAFRVVFVLLMADRVLQAVFLPVISRQFHNGPARLAATTGAALRIIVALALPVVIAGSLLARPGLVFLFGAEFASAAPVLNVLVWFFPLSLLTTLTGYLLLAARRERRFCLNTGIGVAAGLGLSLAGVLSWGPVGAAAGAVAGELVLLVLMGAASRRETKPGVEPRILGAVAGALPMAAALLLLRNWCWPVAFGAGLASYVAVVLLSRAVTLADLRRETQ
ncbi:flippase [candidate division WOR-3 bacterium]|nr:flippase [candidate division WOR-3 bacterium]